MITVKNKLFNITTKNTSYICHVRDGKYVENLYYGKKITFPEGADTEAMVEPLREKFNNVYGNTIAAAGEDKNLTLDNLNTEFSYPAVGDYRITSMLLKADDTFSSRFYFKDSFLYEGLYNDSDLTKMPYARYYEETGKPWTLELIFEDEAAGLELRLIYTAFEDCDVITRRTVLINKRDSSVAVRKLASMQLDLPGKDYSLLTFDGLWTRERHLNEKKLISGTYVTESTVGTSSNRHNPFIMIKKNDAGEHAGDCYAFNLIYSGNHKEEVEVSEYGKIRLIQGINDWCFDMELKSGETFYTPEAVMTYSDLGLNGASANCHDFVNNHIIPEQFRGKERPILINNWEATYFDFNRRKLTGLAKDAAKLGIELFVLDDGWFGDRSDDTSSLGDWDVNEKKIGGPLKDLITEIKKEGMDFGIWVEPEMISEKSRLYEAHPDWAVKAPGREVYTGRNQMVLDYTREDVRDYIVDKLSKLLSDNDVSYVKWDMNRHISDAYSSGDCDSGIFYHRYVLGYYDVMDRLTKSFPHVLFEGCSSGGGRFDLGVLCYMPQIWTSDDTDPNERMMIQGGTSYGYPLSTMGAHVSASPNHQTLRHTSIDTRFQVATMGVLGYELDATRLTSLEKKTVKKQIEFYKQYRKLFQFGRFIRVKKDPNLEIWETVSADRDLAIALLYQAQSEPNQSDDNLFAKGLEENATYKVTGRQIQISIKEFGNLINMVLPVNIKEEGVAQAMVNSLYAMDGEKEEYLVTGSMLMHAGIKLNSRFVGTGLGEGTRTMGDYSSRLYVIERMS